MTIYDIKPQFQNLIRPLVKLAYNLGITPNMITWSAIFLSLIAGVLLLFYQTFTFVFFLIPIVLFVRMLLNALDGMLAKEFDMKSKEGAYLNEMGDIISDIFLYLPFALISGINSVIVVIFVITAMLTECSGILSQAITGDRRYDGPMGKSDRAFFIGAVSLLFGFGIAAGIWTDIVFIIASLLCLATIYNRTRKGLNV